MAYTLQRMLYTDTAPVSTVTPTWTQKEDKVDNEGQPPELPASIAAAWGVREPARRGPRPGLHLEQIVTAAVALADAGGIEAVSMARVAGELGVSTMSLYRYVATKDELLALMLDTAAGGVEDVSISSGWRTGLTNWATGQLTFFRRHPWALRIPISGPPITPNRVRWMELGLQALADTGLSELEKLQTLLLVTSFAWQYASMEVDLIAAAQDSSDLSGVSMHAYGTTLAALIDPERFPALTAALDAGILDNTEEEVEDDLLFGLERILDGIAVLIESRQPTR